ncbi:MAG: mechanosensitive ion channel family protein, partial [Candidatus ainarchaeum sp.]|nr:mechanosensitive ion channel family protein [Candidatus ainarchaeum sp.]
MAEWWDQLINFIFSLPGGRFTAWLVELALFSIILYAIYRAVFYLMRKASEKTKTTFDDELIAGLKGPAKLLIAFTAIFLSLNYTYPATKIGDLGLSALYTVALMVNAAFALDRISITLLKWYQTEIAPKTSSTLDDELVPLIQKVIRAVIYVVAILMILGNLGLQITPLLAGLGIASLAVALALQDSLGNFFAGVNIAVDRPLRRGDYISTDSGIEGVVQEMGWRSTRILNPQNNFIVVPNTKLAQGIITNYFKPDEKVLQTGSVGVSYDSDVNHVSEVIKKAIEEASRSSQNLAEYEPQVRFTSFADSSLEFKFTYAVRNYTLRVAALDEVNRAIFYAFRKEGIEIPFPTRTIHYRGSQQAPKLPIARQEQTRQEPEQPPEKEKPPEKPSLRSEIERLVREAQQSPPAPENPEDYSLEIEREEKGMENQPEENEEA